MRTSALGRTRLRRAMPQAKASWAFCYEILPDVSRTFALTIPVLERPLSDSVCVAYLLCRIADTIEDRNDIEIEPRRWLYRRFSEIVANPPHADGGALPDPRLAEFLARWPTEANAAYQALVCGLDDVMTAYGSLDPQHQRAINTCVQEMVEGMGQMTHPEPENGIVYVCRDLDQLETYCHYVAGTVGLMLTQLFDAHTAAAGAFASEHRLEQGRRFGLGLQLTNILKDHQADWQRGTSFFPADWLQGQRGGLLPHQRSALVRHTLAHLEQAQEYTLAVPAEQEGIRLFCLWALWMAAATLREVARAHGSPPKISRVEVAEILAYTRTHVRDDERLRARFARYREQAAGAAGPQGGMS